MNLDNLIAASGIPPELLILGLPVLAGLLFLAAVFGGGAERKKRKKLIERASSSRSRSASRTTASAINVRADISDSRIPALDRLIKQAMPRQDQLKRRLARTGLDITLGAFLIFCLLVAAVTTGAIAFTGLLPFAAAALIGISTGIMLPHISIGLLAKRRQARFLNDFPEAIDLMTRGLKSGLPIVESIKVVGNEVPGPVGEELARSTDAVRLGGKLEDELRETSERLQLQEFKFFTISLAIQSETGGNLTETLANLSDVLRRRRQLKLKINAFSSEAKTSAYIIGSLPFVMSGIIYMTSPDYLVSLFTDPRGHTLIGFGLCSFAVGAGVMFKMVRFDY